VDAGAGPTPAPTTDSSAEDERAAASASSEEMGMERPFHNVYGHEAWARAYADLYRNISGT